MPGARHLPHHKTNVWLALIQCRSDLAREKRKNAALAQNARVIVDALCEQARSYVWTRPHIQPAFQTLLPGCIYVSGLFEEAQTASGQHWISSRYAHYS